MIAAVAAALVLAVTAGLVAQLARRRTALSTVPAAPRDRAPMAGPAHAAPATDPVGRLVQALRARRWLRRLLSALSIALLAVAVGVLGYPFYTNLYQSRVQARLDRQLASPELRQAYLDGKVGVGDSLTRIKIPSIGVDVVVVEGTTASALRAGAGHYPSTPLPCEVGNVGIAGHRTTYGRPFHDLDRVKAGDTVTLETPIGSCTYVAQEAPFAVAPTALDVVNNAATPMLTLTTCHPKGSASQRLVLKAVLQGKPASA
jgi:sortase A